mgnify:CR=1 FL=1
MVWTIPFKIWSGKDADALSTRLVIGLRDNRLATDSNWTIRLLEISIRGFDRLMPDVPPTAGVGDINMVVHLYRFERMNESATEPTEYAGLEFLTLSDAAMEPRIAGAQLAPLRDLIASASGDSYAGISPIFVAGFNARKGFHKTWSKERAFSIRRGYSAGQFSLCTAPRANLAFDAVNANYRGLILHGTVTLAV